MAITTRVLALLATAAALRLPDVPWARVLRPPLPLARGNLGRSSGSRAPSDALVGLPQIGSDHTDALVGLQQADKPAPTSVPCILTIGDHQYDLSAWAASHPGGLDVLRKSHGKNVTAAFLRVKHSKHAHAMLRDFRVEPAHGLDDAAELVPTIFEGGVGRLGKLFTHEDRFNVHKCLGVFVLLHYVYRYTISLTTDPSGGFGAGSLRRRGLVALAAHGALSCSSLRFSIPRARVVGKPMIWSEFRAHNICFALRSLVCCLLASLAANGAIPRHTAVAGCGAALTVSLVAADAATASLRVNNTESTTATMPYWEGCSEATRAKFKLFYAYCQVGMTHPGPSSMRAIPTLV